MSSSILKYFQSDVSQIPLPTRFTFPFYYDPHPLAIIAVNELKDYLSTQTDFEHEFGIRGAGVGKMFGVLVVKDETGNLGYIKAFSGMMSGSTIVKGFAPPLYDMMDTETYFHKETKNLEEITRKINLLEENPEIGNCRKAYETIKSDYAQKLEAQRKKLKLEKKQRKTIRSQALQDTSKDIEILKLKHHQESLNAKFLLTSYTEYIDQKVAKAYEKYHSLIEEIEDLKRQRKQRSIALQQWLFEKYNFLNIKGESKNIIDIFKTKIIETPPSGAGDCAAPKLLQYAFKNNLTPICMAEFWWGKPHSSQIRKHGNFYPACRGKCEPILGHMLTGLDMDPNPLLSNPALGKKLQTIYEDEYLIVINKPSEFLSVPGKNITDSVQERMKAKYPNATGPMIVHRLDMSTSGLILIGKNEAIYKKLQKQFIKRTIEKRYVAVLDGIVTTDEGYIDLPLRLDIENRPFQIVCHEFGKSARTRYEVIERKAGKTKIYFYPITGRTHQLRVHAAHPQGLNAPIIGDDLYGVKDSRLHLHAESITFTHPATQQTIKLKAEAEF